ncbi:MAG: hypothetical protein LBB86_02055 [Oscillospiraceae bacterium]|nr:hypothetical protein [Oscillospiraceae bacterium]
MPYNVDCVLYDRPCTECGECDRCDIDSSKRCDNCMRCIGLSPAADGGETAERTDYRAIRIDGVLTPDEALSDEEGLST